jgi:DNA-binding Lrp family transcriptional regulator
MKYWDRVEEIIMKLDLTDIRILELLKENLKISMREISQLGHLSPSAIRCRTDKTIEGRGYY